MSEIGNIYARYGEALDLGVDDFESSRKKALEAVRKLYNPLLRDLIRSYNDLAGEESAQRANVLRIFREQFNEGRLEASFAAIDGTSGKEQLSEMMVFYGASYAQNGTLNIGDSAGRLSYARWSPNEDTSFVAYLPIPLTSLSDLQDEDWLFRADDDERSAATMIHTGLMQLAEIYLAYRRVLSEDRPPRILLLDHSLSSTMLSSDVIHLVKPYKADQQTLGWIGANIPRWGRIFEPADGLVAHAHPMNRTLQVPSLRGNALPEYIIAEMTNYWQIGMTGERDPGSNLQLVSLSASGIGMEELRHIDSCSEPLILEIQRRITTRTRIINRHKVISDVLIDGRRQLRDALRELSKDLYAAKSDLSSKFFTITSHGILDGTEEKQVYEAMKVLNIADNSPQFKEISDKIKYNRRLKSLLKKIEARIEMANSQIADVLHEFTIIGHKWPEPVQQIVNTITGLLQLTEREHRFSQVRNAISANILECL